MMERVLLLNGDYRPLGTLPIFRAVNLLIGDKARGIEGIEPARSLKTPNSVFVVPSVIVLQRYVNVPHRNRKWSRIGVMARDNYTCIFCLRSVAAGEIARKDLTIEHLRPRSKGGKSTWSNTATSCKSCNGRKANRTPNEAGMKMGWEPKTPRTNYWVASGNIPKPWKQYVNL